MSQAWICFAVVLAAVIAAGADAVAATERVLTLRFVPQEATGSSSPTLNGGMASQPVAMEFEDARPPTKPTVVGEGTEDDDRPFPWVATNSVKQFAKDVFVETATGWGVRIEPEANPVLALRLWRFFVTETDQPVGSSYAAEVRVGFELKERGGNVLASGLVSGDARRYGRKRSADNCNEVLSDAIKEAYANLLEQSALQAAWPKQASFSEMTHALSPSALLYEVRNLKNQGFGDDTLLRYVNQQVLKAPLSAEDLFAWKEAGISESLIQAALERSPTTKRP